MNETLLHIFNSISLPLRVIILFLVFFLLTAEHRKGQTVIKEKVSLTPQNKLKNFPQLQDHPDWWPCSPPPREDDYYNPVQVVWQNSWYPLNPGRQALQSSYTYNVDTSKYYTFKIISGREYFDFQRNYWDGTTWIKTILDSVTVKGKDLWPKVYKDGTYVTIYDSVKYIDIDNQPYYWCCYFYEYSVHFKGIWNREEEVIYSVTEEGNPPYYVHTFIKRPTYTLTARSESDTIDYNSENSIDVTLEVNECKSDLIGIPRNGGGLNDEVLFTARIVEGSQYGELYTEKVHGDQIQTDNLDVSRGIYFRTEGSQNPDSVALVKVEISCDDIVVSPKTVFIEFYVKNNLNRPPEMKITFDKNELSPWDSTAIHLQKLTSDGQIVDFPSDQLFNIKIADGTDFGILYSEEEGYYSNEFQYVGQAGLRFYSFDTLEDTTRIKIYAETFEEGGSPATSIIGTNLKEKSSSTIKPAFINPGENKISGYGEILIVKSGDLKIKITLTGPNEIWPYLPNQTNGKSRGADRPGYNPYSSLYIDLTRGNQSIPNKDVKITLERIEGTGGHEHTIPPLPLYLSGELKSGSTKGNPIIVSTNADGQIVVDNLLASQVSGKYIIKAELTSNPEINDETGIEVKVPDLVNFGNVNNEGKWSLVGAIPSKHIDVHYCTGEMRNNLVRVLNNFYDWSKKYKNTELGIVLAVNDMSLIWGGAYEYNGDWNVYSHHSFHRVGLSVDINRSGMNDFEINMLTIFMLKNKARRYPERPQIHYGFLGGN
ncbi:hypothetical protein ABRY23_11155 [Melioribacteraceae bacterium 4301-Me]|uniref:hypothetical protein n=1 Tax=Pyranulibacter aquaticus TaxID=3163344 RepID=UPI00359B2326